MLSPIPPLPLLAALGLLVAVVSWAGVAAVRPLLLRLGALDHPNLRSSHEAPKPRGAGLVLIPVILLAWLIAGFSLNALSPSLLLVIFGALLLGLVSWVDDLRGLGPAPRFGAQLLGVVLVLGAGGFGSVSQGLLPWWLDRVFAALAWLWFVNLFNFMDGIDGISGVEAGAIGLGLTGLGLLLGWPPLAIALPLLIAAAMPGFLAWNWAPSRIFLGDVGSVPLGFLLGWLLLDAAARGQWAAALILPAYYLADSGLTLLKRLRRGETLWQAHREHFYQRAARGSLDHGAVCRRVMLANGALIALSLLAGLGRESWALGGAVLVVVVLLAILQRAADRAQALPTSDAL